MFFLKKGTQWSYLCNVTNLSNMWIVVRKETTQISNFNFYLKTNPLSHEKESRCFVTLPSL